MGAELRKVISQEEIKVVCVEERLIKRLKNSVAASMRKTLKVYPSRCFSIIK